VRVETEIHGSRRGWAAGALLAVVASGVTSRATAAETPPPSPAATIPRGLEGAALLEARAPVFVAIHPTDLGDGFALMDLLGGVFPDAMRAINHVRDGLGLYAFSRGELAESGIDPDALVLASWGVADAGDWTPRRSGSRPVFARHRFVLKVIDGDRFERAAVAILSGGDASIADFGHAGATLPGWASVRDVRAAAKKGGVLLLGRRRDGALVAVRRSGDMAVVDYADPWGGAGAAQAGVADVLGRLVAAPQKTLAAALAQGTRRLLSTENVSVALVVAPAALPPLFARPTCRKQWAAADGALMEDAAVLLRLHPFQWRLEVVWGLTPLGRARLGSAATDDGLLDGRTAAADGIAAAGLLLDGFDAVRAAPRPAVLAAGADRALEALDTCGPLAWVGAVARFWPQLAALAVEKLTAPVAAQGSGMPGALRNVAAVVRQLPDAHQGLESSTVLVGSLPASTEPNLTEMLAQKASGRPERQSFGARLPTFFDLSAGTGLSEAGVERIAGDHVGLALTPQAVGLGWYYRLARRPSLRGPQARIGYLHLNLARLLESWAEESDQGTRAAVRMAAGQLGQLGGNMTVDGDLVRLDLNLSGNQ
jgi:hypothetical protein